MTVSSGQSINIGFTTRVFSTGVGTNADSLPTGTLYLNGVSNAATVTVTNVSTGFYNAQVTMPTLTPRDVVFLIIAATVSSITDSCVIWADTTDILLIRAGTAQAGGGSTITLDSGASATNNLYQNETIAIVGGTGAGQTNIVLSYVGSTKVATVGAPWVTNPDSTSIFVITSTGPANVSGTVGSNITQWLGQGVSAATNGIPDVNAKNINNISASAVTTVNANIGVTHAITFDGNNFPKVDVQDWLGTVVATPATAGIPDVNTKNIGNSTAVIDGNGNLEVDVVDWGGTNISTPPSVNTVLLSGQNVNTSTGVTFPSSVASPTNITAGTITTVTNLTNAPTNGDFTAAMKTSLNNATPSVTVTTNNDKTGYTLSSGGIGAIFTANMTESYAAQGAVLTPAQALYGITQFLGQHSTAGTTWTIQKRDGATTAKTYTLDSSTAPTLISETT